MSTRPTEPSPILWAEDALAVVEATPSQPIREAGWLPGVPPGVGRFNWLLRTMARQLSHLMDYTADFAAGERWGYDDTTVLPTFAMGFAPWNWRALIGTPDTTLALPSATPARLEPVNTSPLVAIYDITPHITQILSGATGIARVKRLRVRWKVANAADEVTVSLYQQPRLTSGNPTLVVAIASGTGTTTGYEAAVSSEVDVELEAGNMFFLAAVLDADMTATDVGLSSVVVEFTKSAVE